MGSGDDTEAGSTKLVHADRVLAAGWGECHYQVTDVPPGGGGDQCRRALHPRLSLLAGVEGGLQRGEVRLAPASLNQQLDFVLTRPRTYGVGDVHPASAGRREPVEHPVGVLDARGRASWELPESRCSARTGQAQPGVQHRFFQPRRPSPVHPSQCTAKRGPALTVRTAWSAGGAERGAGALPELECPPAAASRAPRTAGGAGAPARIRDSARPPRATSRSARGAGWRCPDGPLRAVGERHEGIVDGSSAKAKVAFSIFRASRPRPRRGRTGLPSADRRRPRWR